MKLRSYATILLMLPADPSAANSFTAADVVVILRERGWLTSEPSLEQHAWCERAASMLGGHAADHAALADLLGLVFQYHAREIISRVESHVVLSRYAARDVLRRVALLLLDGAPLTSARFMECHFFHCGLSATPPISRSQPRHPFCLTSNANEQISADCSRIY